MNHDDIDNQIKSFLEDRLLVDFSDPGLSEETNLFKEGIIDSYGYMETIKFLEFTFSIDFTQKELATASFVSLKNMKQKVKEKLSG